MSKLMRTKEERLRIGRCIYYGEISRYEAANLYGISEMTAREYMRLYRDANHLPPKSGRKGICNVSKLKEAACSGGISSLEKLSKEELILEVIKARVETERAKKGYMVKGDGPGKKYMPLDRQTTK